ncbi:MAG: DUF4405 domain-containing protein [Tenuifilaceae bacterium]|nr:DUF4405 domain-containing protein [Tenuifilaceae bacterium]
MNSFIKFCRDRAKLNLTIDIILFLLLMAMAGMGFLIKYTLLSGEKRNALYGENINLEFLGMDRHEWGTIHLIISLAFVVFMVLHIIFHWKMVVCFFKRLFPKRTPRILFSILISVVGVLLFVFAFIINPTQVHYGNLYRHRTIETVGVVYNIIPYELVKEAGVDAEIEVFDQPTESAKGKGQNSNEQKLKKNRNSIEEYEVLGTQTIGDVATKYNVPSQYICRELGVPSHSDSQRLGRLRKRYNFSMSDVSRAIVKYKSEEE